MRWQQAPARPPADRRPPPACCPPPAAAAAAAALFCHHASFLTTRPASGWALDYGLGFFGNALESGAYYVEHPRLGPLCFLCSSHLGGHISGAGAAALDAVTDSTSDGGATGGSSAAVTTITPEDGYRRRVFIEPLRLYLVATAGTIARVELREAGRWTAAAPRPRTVVLSFNATEWGVTPWTSLRLQVSQTTAAVRAAGACVVTHGGKAVAPVLTDNSSYALPHVADTETQVVISC